MKTETEKEDSRAGTQLPGKKSWVVRISMQAGSKAYDWNNLEKKNIIHDEINRQPVLLVLADDRKSFLHLKRRHESTVCLSARYFNL
ncbi:MAG: hypothetical protein R3B93_08840 [Bacteroidia bacterium]